MNSFVEAFRENPDAPLYKSYDYRPLDTPCCHDSEPKFQKVLSRGVLKDNFHLTDPKYPESIIGGIVRKNLVLPSEWFHNQTEISGVTMFAKSAWQSTNPLSLDALRPGATTALVDIDNTLYIARWGWGKYTVHRPVLSLSLERDLRKRIRQLFPESITP